MKNTGSQKAFSNVPSAHFFLSDGKKVDVLKTINSSKAKEIAVSKRNGIPINLYWKRPDGVVLLIPLVEAKKEKPQRKIKAVSKPSVAETASPLLSEVAEIASPASDPEEDPRFEIMYRGVLLDEFDSRDRDNALKEAGKLDAERGGFGLVSLLFVSSEGELVKVAYPPVEISAIPSPLTQEVLPSPIESLKKVSQDLSRIPVFPSTRMSRAGMQVAPLVLRVSGRWESGCDLRQGGPMPGFFIVPSLTELLSRGLPVPQEACYYSGTKDPWRGFAG